MPAPTSRSISPSHRAPPPSALLLALFNLLQASRVYPAGLSFSAPALPAPILPRSPVRRSIHSRPAPPHPAAHRVPFALTTASRLARYSASVSAKGTWARKPRLRPRHTWANDDRVPFALTGGTALGRRRTLVSAKGTQSGTAGLEQMLADALLRGDH